MDKRRLIRVSKYLAKHLRHQPDRLGLTLAPGGWMPIEALLEACARNCFPITRAELLTVVAANDKQRFALDETGTLIRANQGHSVEVDLQLEPQEPPALLYHGTPAHAVDSILRTGLCKMTRHHVHLYDAGGIEAARAVARRRGRPVLLEVAAAAMHADGFVFYRSANGVWLVDHVPPAYLRQVDEA
jgi:putative RNA 2'-phosphotransferase